MRAEARQSLKVDGAIVVVLVLLALAPYVQTYRFSFVNFDDDAYITGVPQVRAGLSWSNVGWAFTTLTQNNWHPLTWLSYLSDASMFGLNPGAFHLHNAILHALNAALLFIVLLRLTGNRWPSAVTALLFAVHPLRVESVAWISERKDVLSALFWLLTILLYHTYVRRGGIAKAPVVYAAMLGTFVLSLMAKPMAVSLPFVLLLLDIWPLNRVKVVDALKGDESALRKVGQLALEKLPMLLLVGASSILTIHAQAQNGQAWGSTLPFGIRAANALVSSVRYLRMMIAPYGLIVFYPHPATFANAYVPIWKQIIAITVLLGITGLALSTIRRTPWIAVGWFWYLVTIAPVIGVVQVGAQAMADRYTYIPSIGILIAVVWSVSKYAKSMMIPTAIVTIALLVVTWRQVGFWRDSETLMGRCIAVNPDNYLARNNLGDVYARRGDDEGAIPQFKESLRLNPTYELARVNLANAYARLGHIDEALDVYSLSTRPELTEALHSLALTFAANGHISDAARLWKSILDQNPNHAAAQQSYGLALIMLGRDAEGIAHLRAALNLDGNDLKTLNTLAWALATHPNQSIADPAAAEQLARKAVELNRGISPLPLDTLGVALAREGKFDEAISTATEALRIAQQRRQSELERHIRDRLNLYRNSKPFLSTTQPAAATRAD
jgi:protein O-mannosyl-transferase